jgi:hypothetical protein
MNPDAGFGIADLDLRSIANVGRKPHGQRAGAFMFASHLPLNFGVPRLLLLHEVCGL